jgi:hypothetical protein
MVPLYGGRKAADRVLRFINAVELFSSLLLPCIALGSRYYELPDASLAIRREGAVDGDQVLV